MDGINITYLSLLGSNEKGETYTVEHPREGEFMLGYREAGSINGRHYHKGLSSTKDPEILILLEGNCDLYGFNLENRQEAHFHLEAPCRIEISPMVWHELKALTRIIFYELNDLNAHKQDTFYELPEN